MDAQNVVLCIAWCVDNDGIIGNAIEYQRVVYRDLNIASGSFSKVDGVEVVHVCTVFVGKVDDAEYENQY